MLEPLLLSHNRTSDKLMLQVGVFFYQIVGLGKFKMLLNAVTTIIPTSERCGWRGY